jgi:NitT/TauT family transport system substrate-binding protein
MAEASSRAVFLAAGPAFAAGLSVLAMRPAAAQTERPLHFACSQVEGQAEGYYANELGLFKKAGFAADFQAMRGGSATVSAVVGGAIDVGCTNPISLGQALQRGIKLTILTNGAVWNTKAPSGFAIVAPNSPVKTAKDLNGSIIGIPSLGGLNQMVMSAFIEKNGGDLASVKFVELPESSTLEALNTGRIAASYLDDPQFSSFGDKIRPIGAASDAVADKRPFAETVWFTSADWLANNKDTARKVIDAIFAGGRWATANPDAAATFLAKQFQLAPAHEHVTFDFSSNPAAVQLAFDAAARYNFFKPLRAVDYYWDGK